MMLCKGKQPGLQAAWLGVKSATGFAKLPTTTTPPREKSGSSKMLGSLGSWGVGGWCRGFSSTSASLCSSQGDRAPTAPLSPRFRQRPGLREVISEGPCTGAEMLGDVLSSRTGCRGED